MIHRPDFRSMKTKMKGAGVRGQGNLYSVIYTLMLKGSRDAVLHRMQPISIHGQLSYDVHYRFADEPDSQMRVARVGTEVLSPGLQEGDRIRLDFLVGVVTAVHKA